MNHNRIGKFSGVVGSVVALSGFANSAFADEVTISQPITELRYQANADYTYLVGAARWGSPSCPGAYYATIPAGASNAKQLLAIALAAKLAGSAVSFQGTCSGDLMYFNVNYIVVSQ